MPIPRELCWARSVSSACAAFRPKLVASRTTIVSGPAPPQSVPWFLDEEYRVLAAAEAADPWDPVAVEAAAAEANWVALVAAQSVPKFRSAAERDSYEELRATRAALEVGLAQIWSSLRRLRTEQGSVPALLGEVVAAVGRLPAIAVAATVPDHAGGRKKRGGGGGEGEGDGDGFGAQYGAEEDGV
ncbi:hypothetical protein GMDG_01904 [Pseudogymnoascus destructans 20631-21]|uniref:Uncharacterized protein n=1 Tax=Pseudogymnoascus destructans (strain ATCC MYA-4855 / 20631-21) TaxID=658429 RepID=L8FY81_PSED2|nr:hypothetical protein GMDG_01904 [Pseudogymnoascus destructans 20631-21]